MRARRVERTAPNRRPNGSKRFWWNSVRVPGDTQVLDGLPHTVLVRFRIQVDNLFGPCHAYTRDMDLTALLNECACSKVRTAARAVTRVYDDALRPVGLRGTQLSVLVAVASSEAVSIASLSRMLGM